MNGTVSSSQHSYTNVWTSVWRGKLAHIHFRVSGEAKHEHPYVKATHAIRLATCVGSDLSSENSNR